MSFGYKKRPLSKRLAIRLNIIFISIVFLSTAVIAQERKLVYDVMRNNKVIGHINFVEINQGPKRFLSMKSDVKTSFVFSFTDNTSETATYENGILLVSTFHQKQTGSSEVTKSTSATGSFYKVTKNGVSKMSGISTIKFGMLMMYTHVPDALDSIFSGNYQQMLDITKLEENKFKLTMPDGKYNIYHYKNGVCTKVEIERSLVSLQFVLKEIK